MDDLIEPIRFWHWWILGLALAGIEIVAPGTYLLWLGIAAGLTGALLLVAPGVPWQWQVLVFAALSVTLLKPGQEPGDEPVDGPRRRGQPDEKADQDEDGQRPQLLVDPVPDKAASQGRDQDDQPDFGEQGEIRSALPGLDHGRPDKAPGV